MKVKITPFSGHEEVKLVEPARFGDERGFFSETYNQKDLAQAGLEANFVQDNQSLSRQRGTLRGLHFQRPPYAQGKLVRVVRGRILDVALDIRHGSPTFGQHVSAELSADNWRQLYVPVGYAHGFVTLESDTEVLYKVTNYYSAEHEGGISWNDPALGIDWGIDTAAISLSDKDKRHSTLDELPVCFEFEGR